MNIVAIDDELLPLDLIKHYTLNHPLVTSLQTFNKLTDARSFIENNNVDLLLLDIEMPNQNGLAFYESLNRKPLLILCTAYKQYALDGYKLDAIDYLLKPFTKENFSNALEKAKTFAIGQLSIASNQHSILQLRAKHGFVRINTQDILYIESFKDYLDIHFLDDRKVRIRMTMKVMLDRLPIDHFCRVHRSFIVAKSKIVHFNSNTIMVGEVAIPLGFNYKNVVDKLIREADAS